MRRFDSLPLSRVEILVILILLLLISFLGIQFFSDNGISKLAEADNAITKTASDSPARSAYQNTKDQKYEPELSHTSPGQSYPAQQQITDQNTLPPYMQTEALPTSHQTAAPAETSVMDEEALLNLGEVLENTLLPVFLDDEYRSDTELDQRTAVAIFVSHLPEDMNDSAFLEINALFRDYLPYDIADKLLQDTLMAYQTNAKQQAYLSSIEAPGNMEEQIVIAEQLTQLERNDRNDQAVDETGDMPDDAITEWQKTEARLQEIRSSSSEPESAIHYALKEEYGKQLADDVIELSNQESQWQQKYAVFLEEKQRITRSGLSDEDKAEQIESLIHQHYNEDEWQAARGYDQMMTQQQSMTEE